MGCSVTLSNYSLGDCFTNMGGVKTIWIANYQDDAVSATTSGDTISEFASGITWYKQELTKNTCSITSSLQANENSRYVNTEVYIEYTKMQKESRLQMGALSKGDLMAVVLDKNGNYWFVGDDEPCTASAGSGESGVNRDDKNFYSVTLSTSSEKWPMALEETAIAQLG